MCRLILSLRAKIPVAEMKKSAKIYVINVRIANLDRESCLGSQQRYTGGDFGGFFWQWWSFLRSGPSFKRTSLRPPPLGPRGRLMIKDQGFWQNFIISMCDIQFWKGNENLRSVYKKPFLRNFERFLPFLTFLVLKKGSLSLLRDENLFSLNRSNGASKNPSFRCFHFGRFCS